MSFINPNSFYIQASIDLFFFDSRDLSVAFWAWRADAEHQLCSVQ